MKTITYLLFAIIGLICAICSITILSLYRLNIVQILGLLCLAVFGIALLMIYSYSLYSHIKENRLYDLAAKEQLENDYEYANYGI